MKRIIAFGLFLGFFFSAVQAQALDIVIPVSPTKSFATIAPSSVSADGQLALLTVNIRSDFNSPLTGKTPVVSSSSAGVTITPVEPATDANGMAFFTVSSLASGGATFTISVDGLTLLTKPAIIFTPLLNCSFTPGTLVKLPDDGNPGTQVDSAVYYFGKDCRRHAFPNEKAYFTWYPDFSNVVIVPAPTLASMPLGKNVTYRPGPRMVKFVTVPNVYAVSNGGVLRWIKTEEIAKQLYGADWNAKIDDISDAFFTNYSFGADINTGADYRIANEQLITKTVNDNL